MEFQTSAIVIIILITVFILISYCIYIMYTENKDLKKKVSGLNENVNTLQTNFSSLSEFFQKQLHELTNSQEEDLEEDLDDEEEESEEYLEEELDEERSSNNKNVMSLFDQSVEELQNLTKHQLKIQGNHHYDKLEEISDDSEENDNEDNEDNEDNDDQGPNIDIVISEFSNNSSGKCEKELVKGARKGTKCGKKTNPNSQFCVLHSE